MARASTRRRNRSGVATSRASTATASSRSASCTISARSASGATPASPACAARNATASVPGRARRRCVRPGAGTWPRTRARSRRRRCRRGAAASVPSPSNATIVLSMPTSQAPPSRISATASPEIVGDVPRGRRRDVAEAVGRRRGDATAERGEAARARPDATARAGRRCPGRRSRRRDARGARGRISVSGPGPERGGELPRACRATRAPSARRASRSADVHDHRMVGRAVPWPRRSGARLPGSPRRRPGRRPSRSETRPARRRASAAPRARSPRRRRHDPIGHVGARDALGGHVRPRAQTSARRAARVAALLEADPRIVRASVCGGTGARQRVRTAAGSGNERFSVHVGIGVGRSSGQGRGPDFRCGARRDSRARPDRARRRRDAGLDRASSS